MRKKIYWAGILLVGIILGAIKPKNNHLHFKPITLKKDTDTGTDKGEAFAKYYDYALFKAIKDSLCSFDAKNSIKVDWNQMEDGKIFFWVDAEKLDKDEDNENGEYNIETTSTQFSTGNTDSWLIAKLLDWARCITACSYDKNVYVRIKYKVKSECYLTLLINLTRPTPYLGSIDPPKEPQ